ncbi:hydrogen peroxide-dependent heme synthase [Ornithinicoccus halotolerans]|uniref:hydrogen peroxide-dependent heme synthase n=1 Tax=Ornithinicoccus halotolerans TaxID=1748220 RepID=UPI001294E0A5|nr:hydrogen peroxide-dependent heme synthase [Ornithinicoccus halotolerans]
MTDQHPPAPATETVEDINSGIRYAMYSVFASATPLAEQDRDVLAVEVEQVVSDLAPQGLQVRGWYDVSALRADADLMVWWHAPAIEVLQEAYRRVRRSRLGAHLTPVWSNAAIHRPAEFNRGHVPAFLAGEEPKAYACVYPFVRSYEWYVLPQEERSRMLREHGMAARDYPDVRANTLAAFALGDYEWLLAFEADELHRIVDLMRELRAVDARRHVREEVPFFTGPRVELTELVQRLR